MHLHDINILLNLQGVLATHITEPIENTVYITLEPTDLHQSCPICGNSHTIRRGKFHLKKSCKNLNPYQSKFLKQNKKLLEKRNDSLSKAEQTLLERILQLSLELKEAYWFTEALIEWYDYSNKTNAMNLLEKWIEYGEALGTPEITEALKTFKNWKDEIANYHQCRFTNAAVEGKNNKIKALQRRSYFLRNRQSYEYRIYLECNSEFLPV